MATVREGERTGSRTQKFAFTSSTLSDYSQPLWIVG